MKVKVIPLSKKMKDKVNQHGDIWNLKLRDFLSNRVSLETLEGVHNKGTEPYAVWCTLGVDVKIEEIKNVE